MHACMKNTFSCDRLKNGKRKIELMSEKSKEEKVSPSLPLSFAQRRESLSLSPSLFASSKMSHHFSSFISHIICVDVHMDHGSYTHIPSSNPYPYPNPNPNPTPNSELRTPNSEPEPEPEP